MGDSPNLTNVVAQGKKAGRLMRSKRNWIGARRTEGRNGDTLGATGTKVISHVQFLRSTSRGGVLSAILVVYARAGMGLGQTNMKFLAAHHSVESAYSGAEPLLVNTTLGINQNLPRPRSAVLRGTTPARRA